MVTSEPDQKKLKVTMVCWSTSDDCVITAVSDYTLKIWTVNSGQLEKVLPGHTDEIYVLEAHPHDNNIILSAGHDGQLFIWDILKGEIVFRFLNSIEGQGYGAIFDVKWSPSGCVIAASDSHGHILTFGFGTGSPLYEQVCLINSVLLLNMLFPNTNSKEKFIFNILSASQGIVLSHRLQTLG